MTDLKTILLNKYKQKKLAHFYILNPSLSIKNPEAFLENWILDFLLNVIQLHNPSATENSIMNHPDIMFLNPTKESKKYKVEDFGDFFKFIDFNPMELPWRFIIISSAHLINETVSNKLLKSLENPGDNVTIIFANTFNIPFIPTIESRAIKLTIKNPKPLTNIPHDFYPKEKFVDWLNLNTTELTDGPDGKHYLPLDVKKTLAICATTHKGFNEFTNLIRNNYELQESIFSLLLDWERQHNSSFETKEKFLSIAKKYQTSRIFNSSVIEHLSALLYL